MEEESRIHIEGLSPAHVALLKQVAQEAAEKAANGAVRGTLTALGIDVNNPISSQELFVAMRERAEEDKDPEFLADKRWVRRTRGITEGAFGKAIVTAVGVSIAGALHSIYIGIQTMFRGS